MDAVKTDVGAAKPTLSPFAKNKNLIELKVFFLVILHLDLCPGKVWEFSLTSLPRPVYRGKKLFVIKICFTEIKSGLICTYNTYVLLL